MIPHDPEPVDLRGLPPPEPLERILAVVEARCGGPVSFLLSMEPLLLYPLLRRQGVRWRIARSAAGVEITIEARAHEP